MHDVLTMEIGEGLADILEVAPDFWFGNGVHLELVVKCASLRVL